MDEPPSPSLLAKRSSSLDAVQGNKDKADIKNAVKLERSKSTDDIIPKHVELTRAQTLPNFLKSKDGGKKKSRRKPRKSIRKKSRKRKKRTRKY
jgi:hypothetical protein